MKTKFKIAIVAVACLAAVPAYSMDGQDQVQKKLSEYKEKNSKDIPLLSFLLNWTQNQSACDAQECEQALKQYEKYLCATDCYGVNAIEIVAQLHGRSLKDIESDSPHRSLEDRRRVVDFLHKNLIGSSFNEYFHLRLDLVAK